MQDMITVQVRMSGTDGSRRFTGTPQVFSEYGIQYLTLTTPSGDAFTWNVDRIQQATNIIPATIYNQTHYRWPR